MQKDRHGFNLLVITAVTGIGFLVGGIVRTLLLQQLVPEGVSVGLSVVIPAVWFSYIVESAIGMAVLAYLFRKHYPFRRLWFVGIGAFALGSLLPAILLNQFFHLLLLLPGTLIALLFDRFLNERVSRGRLP